MIDATTVAAGLASSWASCVATIVTGMATSITDTFLRDLQLFVRKKNISIMFLLLLYIIIIIKHILTR